eukprot:7893196-Pyramimonas_sp.AAC.1
MKRGSFTKCGSRRNAAHTRFKHVQELHTLRAGRFENVAPTLAPRAPCASICKSLTGSHG